MHSLLHSTHKYPHFKNKNKIPDSLKHCTLWIVFLSFPPSFASKYGQSLGYFCSLLLYSYHSVPLDDNQYILPPPLSWHMLAVVFLWLSHCFWPPWTPEKSFQVFNWTILLLCLELTGYLACFFLKWHFARHLSSMLHQALPLPLITPLASCSFAQCQACALVAHALVFLSSGWAKSHLGISFSIDFPVSHQVYTCHMNVIMYPTSH